MKPIGGGWSIEDIPKLPEAGIHPRNLVRTAGNRKIVVDELIQSYRFYEPDCVVYQSARQFQHVYAVCGDRLPIAIGSSTAVMWKFEDEGPRRVNPREVRNGRIVEVIEVLPIEDVKAIALQQRSFRKGNRAAPFNRDAPPVSAVTTERPVDLSASPEVAAEALAQAVVEGNKEMVDALVIAGADVNRPGREGTPPLIYAAGNRQQGVLERLLAAGANVNATDRDGETALMTAAGVGETDIVRRLLEAGADPQIRDRRGRTALDHVAAGAAELAALLRDAEVRRRH
jgi:hypothetical protein